MIKEKASRSELVFRSKWYPFYRFSKFGNQTTWINLFVTKSKLKGNYSLVFVEKKQPNNASVIGITYLSRYFIREFARALNESVPFPNPKGLQERYKLVYGKNYAEYTDKSNDHY